MRMSFNQRDSDELNNYGYICGKPEEDGPLLIVLTLDGLQAWADNFAAGHSVKLGGEVIKGNASYGVCPKCQAEKN